MGQRDHDIGIKSGLRIRGRLLISFLGLAIALILALVILIERTARQSLEAELATRLESVAAAATIQIDPSLMAAALSLGAEGTQRTRSRLEARLTRLRDATGVRRIYLIDRSGRGRLDTDPDAVPGRELPQARIHRRMLETAATGQTASSPLFRDAQGQMRKTGYAPVTVSGSVVGFIGVDADARFLSEIGKLRRRMILIGLVGFFAAAVLSVALARGLTRPLGRLVQAARAMGRGDLANQIPIGRADEVGFLAKTLDEARLRLAERDRSLRAMVAGIAHEVRNPLGGIQIYAELLDQDPKLTESQRERIGKVLREIDRLGEIVSQFLTYARPQTPERIVVEPRAIVSETLDLLQNKLEERGIEVTVAYPDGNTSIQADPGQLRQILVNLVRNAADACKPGGKIAIGWESQGPTVAMTVEDNGPGIPLAKREQVFEPFFTTKADGAGLGLAIVRHLAEQNGGRVSLERAQLGGSRFTVRLEAAGKGTDLE